MFGCVNHKNVKKALRPGKLPLIKGLFLRCGVFLSTESGERLWENSVDSFLERRCSAHSFHVSRFVLFRCAERLPPARCGVWAGGEPVQDQVLGECGVCFSRSCRYSASTTASFCSVSLAPNSRVRRPLRASVSSWATQAGLASSSAL